MKHNFMTKMVSALLAVVLSTSAFSVTAFASGGEESTESVAEQETAGDVSDLLSALAGSQVTVSVTEDGIQFSSGENDSGQTGTVTTGGGNLNVRMGAGMGLYRLHPASQRNDREGDRHGRRLAEGHPAGESRLCLFRLHDGK